MATVSHPIPSLPVGMMQLKLRWLWLPVPGYQEFWADLFFFAYAGVTWTHFPSTFFGNLFNNFLNPYIHSISPTGMQNPQAQVFVACPTVTLSARFAPVYPNFGGLEPLGMPFRPCFSKFTGVQQRWGIGRFYGPPVPAIWLDGNRYNSTGLAAYQNFADSLLTLFDFGGTDWQAVHWSRSQSSIYALEQLRLLQFPRVLRKSVLRTPYLRPLYVWPTVV